MRSAHLSRAALISICSATAAQADIFDLTVTTEGVSGQSSYSNIEDLFDVVDDVAFDSINSSYTDTSIATALLNVRGVPVVMEFPDSGPTLVFRVESLGVEETFTGADRDASEAALRDFLENEGQYIIDDLLEEFVATTPFDPVAGNPNSLQSNMVTTSHEIGTAIGDEPSLVPRGNNQTKSATLTGVNARFGAYTVDGKNVDVFTLPIKQQFALDDTGMALIFQAPLTVVNTDGSYSGSGILASGIRVPILPNWSVTPSASFGAVASRDAGSLALMYGANVTSNVAFPVFGLRGTLGNTLGITQTLPTDYGDFTAGYDLTNIITRNGVGISGDVEVMETELSWEASVANTQFFGDEVYIDNYTDIAVSFGMDTAIDGVLWEQLRVGVTYTFSNKDYDGFRLNLGYNF